MKTHCVHGHEYTIENTHVSLKGVRSCRKCRSSYSHISHKKNPELQRAASRRWWAKKLAENPNFRREIELKFEYDMTLDEFNQKRESQKNCCAICNRLMDKPCVDHDHDTGKVRDLLCKNCNCALGLLQDDVLIVAKAAEYLKRWKLEQ